ncbi:MAG: hypothetical protein BWY87_01415 [Deltaproteobacteria bacterium ADurb.Bin510]|nr:MAG: hypothetical protein BWY87_01415 [Deltaproteobacteria bacterium ADurb.Bin510]
MSWVRLRSCRFVALRLIRCLTRPRGSATPVPMKMRMPGWISLKTMKVSLSLLRQVSAAMSYSI